MVLNFEVCFRDLDEEDMSEFDLASMSFDGKFEGPVEKKLRETGEQLNTWTETEFRASGNYYNST